MGHLVYKPEDYRQQTYAIPEKYLKEKDSHKYIDISALWENIPVIKNFKEELRTRCFEITACLLKNQGWFCMKKVWQMVQIDFFGFY